MRAERRFLKSPFSMALVMRLMGNVTGRIWLSSSWRMPGIISCVLSARTSGNRVMRSCLRLEIVLIGELVLFGKVGGIILSFFRP